MRESTAVDLQQTSVSTGARSAASDKVPLVFYGKTGGEQGQQGTAEQGRELKGEHLKNCEGLRIAPPDHIKRQAVNVSLACADFISAHLGASLH